MCAVCFNSIRSGLLAMSFSLTRLKIELGSVVGKEGLFDCVKPPPVRVFVLVVRFVKGNLRMLLESAFFNRSPGIFHLYPTQWLGTVKHSSIAFYFRMYIPSITRSL